MIQRATDAYLLRLTAKVEEGGFWHLHHRGIEPPNVQQMANLAFADDLVLTPIVNDGRWIVVCPHCGGAQLASPSWSRFLCADCGNVAFGGRWLPVEWPAEDLVEAGEALLSARPDPATRHWDPAKETVGALKAENVIFGALFDPVTGAVAGDLGHPPEDHMIPTGAVTPALPRRGR